MYELMKSVICAGNYKLTEIRYKIKKLYVLGDLTEGQTDELLALASGGVSADAERPEVLEMLRSLDARVSAVEKTLNMEGEQPAYDAWKPWDGISDNYRKGAVVSHNGLLYESVYDGQNVWEPGAAGTENLWKLRQEV